MQAEALDLEIEDSPTTTVSIYFNQWFDFAHILYLKLYSL